MPKFSSSSKQKLETCHPDLQRLFNKVIEYVDCTILSGVRTEEEQLQKVTSGLSTTLNSKHLKQADGYSHAVDVAPYPIDWNDTERFILFAGIVRGIAMTMNIGIRSGVDWDNDLSVKDHNFFDGPHFELTDV